MNDKITLLFKSITETFSACPKYNMAMAACLLIVGLMPALNVYSTGALVAIFEHPNGANSIVFVILLWGVSMLLPTLLEPLISYLQSHINQLVTHKITTNLMYKNASFRGLHAYDDTDIQDTIAVLKSQSRFRPTNFIVNSVVIIRECITISALSVILFSVKWWIPFAVLLSAAPLSYINFRVASFSWQALIKAGKHNRFMDYFATLTFSREAQKDIHFNNQDIRAYKIAALRDCIGAVFQDFFKFNLSINDNITLNKHSRANPSDVKHALGLADDVSLDTFIGKSYGGIELSGGQWQKLAILRCLHANSSMIILDEPTSAIDPKAEAKLYDDFKALCRGRLSFMITHRLGSINGVDRVLVIDNGRLVQDGTPAHLKAVEGMFQELWRIQSAMYAP